MKSARFGKSRKLVEALRKILDAEFGNITLEKMERIGGGSYWSSAAALLRELGEEA